MNNAKLTNIKIAKKWLKLFNLPKVVISAITLIDEITNVKEIKISGNNVFFIVIPPHIKYNQLILFFKEIQIKVIFILFKILDNVLSNSKANA